MGYLKSLFFNFLVVFFANYILPGIAVMNQTKLPHLGGDLPFALALGLLNSLIYPILRLIHKHPSVTRIGMFALVLNFAAYALLKFLPLGIHIASVEGYLFASFFVAVGSFVVNFFEMKHCQHKCPGEPLQ